jgi:hypothetical protein
VRLLHAVLVAAAVSAAAAGAGIAALAARERWRADRDAAARIWWWPSGRLTPGRPYVFRGGDEFGNRTIACRVPFGMVIVATTVPLRRELLPLDVEPDWA